jgi:hypothetical protein
MNKKCKTGRELISVSFLLSYITIETFIGQYFLVILRQIIGGITNNDDLYWRCSLRAFHDLAAAFPEKLIAVIQDRNSETDPINAARYSPSKAAIIVIKRMPRVM